MDKYTNEKCPVCGKLFEDGDDVVVCPECGTPHHRECYKELHRCANASRHKEGFVFEMTAEPPKEKKTYSSPQEEYEAKQRAKQAQMPEQQFCHICGEPVEKGATMCAHCGAVLLNQELSEDYYQYSQDNAVNEEIDGEDITDVASVVGSNASRFIPIFKKNKKVSWNWGAFFFGPYYLFYRKMYRAGLIATVISLASQFIIQGLFAERLATFTELLNSKTYRDLSGNPFANSELIEQLSNETAVRDIFIVYICLLISAFVIRIVLALLADSMYRQQVLRTVKDVNKRLDSGDYFAPSPLMGGDKNELTQKQMKQMFLSRRGGVTIFAPIAVYFALDLLISYLTGF